jgi:hypothetical protein
MFNFTDPKPIDDIAFIIIFSLLLLGGWQLIKFIF